MGEISFEVQGDRDKLIQKIESKISELPRKLTEALDGSARYIEIIMKSEAPEGHGETSKTGTKDLRHSIGMEERGPTQRFIGPDLDLAPHAVYVEYGTPPHLITAVNAMALGPFAMSSYLGVRIGGFVGSAGVNKYNLSTTGLQFFKSVHHPGTSPNDFIGRTREQSEDTVLEYFEDLRAWITED